MSPLSNRFIQWTRVRVGAAFGKKAFVQVINGFVPPGPRSSGSTSRFVNALPSYLTISALVFDLGGNPTSDSEAPPFPSATTTMSLEAVSDPGTLSCAKPVPI